ncbi:MAG: branched-chain amino acid ABC transporter permease [Hyphomicrobiales bacterium]
MAFDVVASSRQEKEKFVPPWRRTLVTGLTFGGIALYFAMVGILTMFHERWVIYEYLSLGHALLGLIAGGAGLYLAYKTKASGYRDLLLQGAGAGAIAGSVAAVLAIIISQFKLRFVFVQLKPQLLKMLTFNQDVGLGIVLLVLGAALLGALGVVFYVMNPKIRRPLVAGLGAVGLAGLFQELIQLMLQTPGRVQTVREALFTWDGLTLQGAVIIFVVTTLVMSAWQWRSDQIKAGFGRLPQAQQKSIRLSGIAFGLLLLLLFPLAAGNFIGQVLMMVGLFTLMGMGLNIEIGLAGLLDLGFVAFYAVGAYTTALLTADSPHALAHLSYWVAMPIAVLLSIVVGVLFGVPVLRVRGDYLAVATLGLGEIVRVIVLSDAAAPLLAGAQGVLNIPRPNAAGYELGDPVSLFYLTLVCALVAAYIAWALENSRLGRAWTAIRDDEDVAQALGINLVNVKLLAYGLGAAFAGLAGSIFAVMLSSIYPHSFQLIISINILALIIVGGMGSLPGVALGALALIGLPELLREFGEYRFLFYGLVIVIMMRIGPEGLVPSAARRREMRVDAEERAAIAAELGAETPPTSDTQK